MNQSKIALALRAIATGFDQLADALSAPAEVGSSPRSSAKPSEPPPDPPGSEGLDSQEEPETVELKDLQDLGRKLIKAGKRDHLSATLESFDVANFSSAREEDYAKIAAELRSGL